MGDLTTNFSKWEMTCSCGCGLCNVDSVFMNSLQAAREIADVPFRITSGCRCKDCNKNAGGKPTSDHLTSKDITCKGADIACSDSTVRFAIISACLTVGFSRFGIGSNFVHIGMRTDNPQFIMWIY